jgi:hypothetical protein
MGVRPQVRFHQTVAGGGIMTKFVVQWYSSSIGWYDVKELTKEQAVRESRKGYTGIRVVERSRGMEND